jgi:protein-S-isoprenylcysteine O-methyltransferase Ste14
MTIKARWIGFIYNAATGSRKARNFFTPLGALIYGFLIFSFVAVSLLADRLLGLGPVIPEQYRVIVSAPVFLAALVLIGWSVLNFLKAKGTPVPINPPPRLVTSGPYAYSRNPMLTGVFCLLFGFGLYFGSLSLLFVFTPLFIYINYWELKAIEEPELEIRLGEEYMEYRKRTPMFFPGFGKIFRKRTG